MQGNPPLDCRIWLIFGSSAVLKLPRKLDPSGSREFQETESLPEQPTALGEHLQ